MRGADEARWNAIPFRIIPALGHVPENSSHTVSKECCHVLHDCVSRSNHANGSNQMPVEPRTGAGNAGALSSSGHVLTREPATDDICVGKFGGCDISKDWNVGPVLGEDPSGIWFDLTKGDGFETVSSF
jgi:hypothetical protein